MACTFLNPPAYLACNVCGTERRNPNAAGEPSVAAAAAAAAVAPAAGGQQEDEERQADAGRSTWKCGACTYRNRAGVGACEMCTAAAPGSTQVAPDRSAAQAAAAASASARPPALAALCFTQAALGRGKAGPQLTGDFTLDCGCRLPAAEAQERLQQAAAALPSTLSALARHFLCTRQVRGLHRSPRAMLLCPRAASSGAVPPCASKSLPTRPHPPTQPNPAPPPPVLLAARCSTAASR